MRGSIYLSSFNTIQISSARRVPLIVEAQRQMKEQMKITKCITHGLYDMTHVKFPELEEAVFYRSIALNVWFAFICVYCMAFTNTLFGKEGPLEVHKYLHGFLLGVGTF